MPKSIKLALCIVGFLALNSFVAQLLLMSSGHKTSLRGLVIWTSIYLAIGIGLAKRMKPGFWSALVVSVLQTLPLIASKLIPVTEILGRAMPSWYEYSLYASAGLGIALFVVLTLNPSRKFFFEPRL